MICLYILLICFTTDEEATTIRQLEIFPIYTADNQRRFTSLEVKLNRSIVGKRVALLSTMDGLQPEVLGASVNFHFLLYSTAQEKAFYDYLNIFTVSRGDYFIQEVIPNLKSLYANYPEQTVATLLNMLESLSSLNRDNTRFIQQLQQSSFVPTVSPQETVEFKIPSEVFDPSVPQMSDLLGGEFFPMSSFCREDYLVFLRSVGLKTVLDWPALITCAQSIENLPEISREESQTKLARANNLLKYLESNIDRLTGKEKKQKAAESSFSLLGLFFAGDKPGDKHISLQEIDSYLESLQYISWFPCLVEPPNRCMPWHAPAKGKLSILASPVVVSPLSEAWLCSATRRIALSDVSSSLLRKSLGFGNPHSIQTIAMQLKELATKFRDYLSSTDLVDSELQNLRVVVTGLIPQLYERLNSAPQDRYELIVSILESCSWIWVGDDFVPPLKVAINAGVNAAPFLYQLPQDLHVFTNLFSLFKVKQNFNYIDYIAALRSMAETTGAVSQEISDSQPLSVTHLDMAISLVTLLSTEGADSLARHTIYVPDSVGKLHPSTKLVNDDVPWLSGPQYLSVRSDCKFIHPNISSRVAEKLGVQSLRHTLISKNMEQNLFVGSNTNTSAIESFGQAESLTR